MLPQSKTARERMLASGFTMKQFWVQTVRYRSKRDRAQFGDYGEALIIPRLAHCPNEEIMKKIPDMRKNGLSIDVWTREDKPRLILIASDGKGTYQKRGLDEQE